MVAPSSDVIDTRPGSLNSAGAHVWLRVPQSLARGGDGPKPLQATDQLVYLYLTAARDNAKLTHRVVLGRAAFRCGIHAETIVAAIGRLAQAGLVEVRDPGSKSKGPKVYVPRPDGDCRFNIPLALVWPLKAGPARWGKDTPKVLRTVLAIVAALDGLFGGSTERTVASIAASAGLKDSTLRAGLQLLFGAGEPGGVLRRDGELLRDEAGRCVPAFRTTAGGWLTSQPQRRPAASWKPDAEASKASVQAASRITVDWSLLPPVVAAGAPESGGSGAGVPEMGGSAVPESGGSAVPEMGGSGVPESGGSKCTGTPACQVPPTSGALLLQPEPATRETDDAAPEREEDGAGENSTTTPGPCRVDAGAVTGKDADDAEPGSGRESRRLRAVPGTGTGPTLREWVADSASRETTELHLAQAVEAVGSHQSLCDDDKLALVHAHLRHAPVGSRFVLTGAESAHLDVDVRARVKAGHCPLNVGGALTSGSSDRVDNPVAVLRYRLRALPPVPAACAHPPTSVWPDAPPSRETGRRPARAADRTYTAEDYAQPL